MYVYVVLDSFDNEECKETIGVYSTEQKAKIKIETSDCNDPSIEKWEVDNDVCWEI